jgi:hypothetical protein
VAHMLLEFATNAIYAMVFQVSRGHSLRAARTAGQAWPARSGQSLPTKTANERPRSRQQHFRRQFLGDLGGVPHAGAVRACVSEVFGLFGRRHA